MFAKGLVTAFLYLASLITFLLAMEYTERFTWGFALGGLFFVVATGMLVLMMKKRMEKQNF